MFENECHNWRKVKITLPLPPRRMQLGVLYIDSSFQKKINLLLGDLKKTSFLNLLLEHTFWNHNNSKSQNDFLLLINSMFNFERCYSVVIRLHLCVFQDLIVGKLACSFQVNTRLSLGSRHLTPNSYTTLNARPM